MHHRPAQSSPATQATPQRREPHTNAEALDSSVRQELLQSLSWGGSGRQIITVSAAMPSI